MINEAIVKITDRRDLSFDEAGAVMDEIMSGKTSPVQTAAFLTALTTKGETIDEITACAQGMRRHGLLMHHHMDLLEIVGTGGDQAKSFNISTTAAIVIAAGGVAVAKHGNRAASSKSGAADVLEALGVNLDVSPERCLQLLQNIGICFFFAPKYHSSMRYVGPVRRELGIRTIFNVLGPLTNPAAANHQVLGVYAEKLLEPMAKVLSQLGVKRGMVVYGHDRLDEISASAPTSVCEFKNDRFTRYVIQPEDFDLRRCCKEDLVGGTPKENAAITLAVLRGEIGPKRTTVLMNAGAGLYIAGKVACMADGIRLAATVIDSGKAMEKLAQFIVQSNEG